MPMTVRRVIDVQCEFTWVRYNAGIYNVEIFTGGDTVLYGIARLGNQTVSVCLL
jgi:hypothetical protein